MSKVITLSQAFPDYHINAGQQTDFVRKVWESLYSRNLHNYAYERTLAIREDLLRINTAEMRKAADQLWVENAKNAAVHPKHNTIRAGYRWKSGEKASLRVWSGIPYRSKQIIIAPDVRIRVWNFKQKPIKGGCSWKFGKEKAKVQVLNYWEGAPEMDRLAANDGLELRQLISWFKVPEAFEGQIICWNENINY